MAEIAISFMDLADFSVYTATEGDEAAVALIESFLDVAELFVKGARGTVVKRLGDGILASYHGAADGVRASLAIQHAFAARGAMAPGQSGPRARIGLHWGSAVERAGDLYGYDVNLAARVMEAAEPGQVLVTEAVKEQLTPFLPGVRLRAIGRLVAKGVKQPVRLYEVQATSGARHEVPSPVTLPDGWVLGVDLFDVKTSDASALIDYARQAEAAVVGLGGRILFLGVGVAEGLGQPRQLVSLVAFPSAEAFSAYLHDPDLAHLAESRERMVEHQDLMEFVPVPTLRWAGPFGMAEGPQPQELPELPPVPLVELLRRRRRGRGRGLSADEAQRRVPSEVDDPPG